MHVDAHAHYFPDGYLKFLDRTGAFDVPRLGNAPGLNLSLDERFALMDQYDVDMQVLGVGGTAAYLPDRALAIEGARIANDEYAEVCARYPKRLAALGTLPLPHTEDAVAEIGRCLDDLGMVGITLCCSIAGRPLDDSAFEPVFAELHRRQAPLVLHPMGIDLHPLANEMGLRPMIGLPVEDSIAALRLVLAGVTTRYPDVKIVVPHLGGVLPFLMQRLDDTAERLRARDPSAVPLASPPSELVKLLYYDTVNNHPPALRCACDTYGTERLVFGTDFPFLAGDMFGQAATYLGEVGLSPEAHERIFGGTAAALFGLDGA